MWKLFKPLFETAWALKTPVAACVLIFGGMALLSEISSRYERDAAFHAALKACAGKTAQQDEKEPSC